MLGRLPVTRLALAGALCLAGACGQGADSGAPGNKLKPVVKTSVSTVAHTNAGEVCATFTLAPFQITGADNGLTAVAGSAVTFSTDNTTGLVDQLLGCIAGPAYPYTPEASTGVEAGDYNWGYFVSATNFHYCDLADTSLDPTQVFPAPAYFQPVLCSASNDMPLTISYPVSLAGEAQAGFIDVSASISPTTQYVGCKSSDLGQDGALHFGQSFLLAAQPGPLGLVAFTATEPSSDHSVSQYGGQVGGQIGGQALFDTFYSGQITGGTLPSRLFQTYLSSFDESHVFGAQGAGGDDGQCGTGEWADARHAFCLTSVVDGAPATPTTAALADAFLYSPGIRFAAATVNSGGAGITVYSQMAVAGTAIDGMNSGADYTAAGAGVVSMDWTGGFSSSYPGHVSTHAGFNDALQTRTVGSGEYVATGLYIDPAHLGQFLVALTFSSGEGILSYWTTLAWDPTADAGAGNWTFGPSGTATPGAPGAVGAPVSLSDGLPPGFGVAARGCVTQLVPRRLLSVESVPGAGVSEFVSHGSVPCSSSSGLTGCSWNGSPWSSSTFGATLGGVAEVQLH